MYSRDCLDSNDPSTDLRSSIGTEFCKIAPSPNAAKQTALTGDDLVDAVANSENVPSITKSILSYNTAPEEQQIIVENHKRFNQGGSFLRGCWHIMK